MMNINQLKQNQKCNDFTIFVFLLLIQPNYSKRIINGIREMSDE